mmetsp:Transcript_26287/g.69077  ORF Transcript_26287/g.69077 Transcript_26287/m.69077 type:complete len:338 (-) Transcript_26287:479-1492(-)
MMWLRRIRMKRFLRRCDTSYLPLRTRLSLTLPPYWLDMICTASSISSPLTNVTFSFGGELSTGGASSGGGDSVLSTAIAASISGASSTGVTAGCASGVTDGPHPQSTFRASAASAAPPTSAGSISGAGAGSISPSPHWTAIVVGKSHWIDVVCTTTSGSTGCIRTIVTSGSTHSGDGIRTMSGTVIVSELNIRVSAGTLRTSIASGTSWASKSSGHALSAVATSSPSSSTISHSSSSSSSSAPSSLSSSAAASGSGLGAVDISSSSATSLDSSHNTDSVKSIMSAKTSPSSFSASSVTLLRDGLRSASSSAGSCGASSSFRPTGFGGSGGFTLAGGG